MLQALPIDLALPEILGSLREKGALVLVAPPGSGKTTRVPPAILEAGLCGSTDRVLVLQPRRVAARLAAGRIASERGLRLGEEVGYRVRFEDCTGPATRLEILTEGLLVRMLQDDPFLEGVGCVVLDEFHERSLHVDLALAMLAELRASARPELLLVVMSATMDPEPVRRFLGGPQTCALVRAPGRLHPVEIIYLGESSLEARSRSGLRVASTVRRALDENPEGHILAFLPGVGEIEDAAAALADVPAQVLMLHSRLSSTEQDRALAPSPRRKVVLATNIAETSVTLEGVRVVIDAGLHRVPHHDPAIGLERLELEEIPQDSADQRAGRAGRTGPGRCYRLDSASRHALRPLARVPDIRRTDLAGTLLQIRAWGAKPRTFRWFEPPPEASLRRAEELLVLLGALEGDALSSLGRALAALPVHPRLGRVVLAGAQAGILWEASLAAALVSEADPFLIARGAPEAGTVDGDLHWRVEELSRRERAREGQREGYPVDRRRLSRLLQAAAQLRGLAGRVLVAPPLRGSSSKESALARVLLTGFPDRVGKRRPGPGRSYQLVSGSGARLLPESAVGDAELILAISMEAGRPGVHREHLIRAACVVERDWLGLTTRSLCRFEPSSESVQHLRETRFGALVLELHPAPGPPDPEIAASMLEVAARESPQRALCLDEALSRLVARLRFLAIHMPELGLPALWDLGELLPGLCVGRRSFSELRSVDLTGFLLDGLSYRERQILDAQAPERLTLPSGVRARVAYPGESLGLFDPETPRDLVEASAPDSPLSRPPVLAARIQHLFGLRSVPRLAGGRVPVQVHLLAPSGRVAHITQDLEHFWKNTWLEVRKDLRGRYPRHAWPEDPSTF